MTERLTTLQAVKDYLGITTDGSDTFLTRLIDAASQFSLSWMGRDSFQVRTYTQNFRGNGKTSAILYNWPVLSVSSVGIAGSAVAASTFGNVGMPNSGYVISDPRGAQQFIELYGYSFWNGAPSQVVYTAGFRTTVEGTLPDIPGNQDHTVTPVQAGQWTANIEVIIDGVPGIEVTANPNAGEYVVDEWGSYTFSAADDGKPGSITYDYVPWDVAFAVTELVGEWYKRKDRIGVVSKSLSGGVGESVTFSQKDMGESIRAAFQPYANVVPM